MSALKLGNVRYNARTRMFEAMADMVTVGGLQRVPVEFSASERVPFSTIADGLASKAHRKSNQAKQSLRLI